MSRSPTFIPVPVNLASGTPILVVEDAGCGITETKTRSEPWMASSDHWSVLLEGRSGGFLLSRVFYRAEVKP